MTDLDVLERHCVEIAHDLREPGLVLDTDPDAITRYLHLPAVELHQAMFIPPEHTDRTYLIDGHAFPGGSCRSGVVMMDRLAYGDPGSAVRVAAHNDDETFELSVANNGEPIPSHLLDKVFEPFNRGSRVPGQQGLGLGLYIASQIARAHDGTLSAVSTSEETRFTLRMPISGARPVPQS